MILVTGGTGLVGAHLLFQLSQKEEKIRAIRRTTSSPDRVRKLFSYYSEEAERLFSQIEWVDGDILDPESLLKAMEGVHSVYHTAALVSFDSQDYENIMETNVIGTANVVNACLETKVKALGYVSSVAALGRAGNEGIITEKTEWKPGQKTTAYAISKYEAEREVWRGMAEGLKVVVVNPTIILGPGDFHKGSAKMFQTVYNGLKVYTAGINGYVATFDVAKALVLLMENHMWGERFLLNSENISYKDLFAWMAEALKVKGPSYNAGKFLSALSWRVLKVASLFTGKRPLITRQTAQTANSVYRYSNEKFVKATGMKFTPIRDTIRQTAAIFLKEQ
jgi:dihydroflavonol-4-reductase